MDCHEIQFHGSVLKRGFWLYVWRVTHKDKEFFYVGRTGDNSSRFASSPFVRIGRHLDHKKNASANMLYRHLEKEQVDPTACFFEFFCVGPLFCEQDTMEAHLPYRDIVSRLEGKLWEHCAEMGKVFGKKPKSEGHDAALFKQAVDLLKRKMKARPSRRPPQH